MYKEREYTEENIEELYLRIKALLSKFILWYDTESYNLILMPNKHNKAKNPFVAIQRLFNKKIKGFHWIYDIDKQTLAYINENSTFIDTKSKPIGSCPPNASCAVVSFKSEKDGWTEYVYDNFISCDCGTDKWYEQDCRYVSIPIAMEALSSIAVAIND